MTGLILRKTWRIWSHDLSLRMVALQQSKLMPLWIAETPKHCTSQFIGNVHIFCGAVFLVCFVLITLSLCSRLANNQLEKEKAELIHQIETQKDQSGAETTMHGNVVYNILGDPSCLIRVSLVCCSQISDNCLPIKPNPQCKFLELSLPPCNVIITIKPFASTRCFSPCVLCGCLLI